MAACKLPAVMGPWNKSNCQSGLGTPPRQCFLDLAKFVLGNIFRSLLTERVTRQCSPGCIGGEAEKHLNLLTDYPLGLLYLALWDTRVYLTLGVICEPEWTNPILKFGICTLHSRRIVKQYSYRPFCQLDLFLKTFVPLRNTVVSSLLACICCCCCCCWFYPVVQFVPAIWENWTIWV